MAYTQTTTVFHDVQHNIHPLRHPSRPRFVAELSQCLFDFVIQLLPTPEEMAVKEDVRKLLERLIRTIEPDSRLLSFGSTANGFSLRNSDMDLCCLIDSDERLAASDLVTMLGDLLERETKFHVKPLPHARIPIVKLTLDPSPGLPLGIACDIGFENRLALENTRLLMCYAMIDPTRVRTLVLFLKVWSKRRKINSPYKGTLSSYGYVLLVIYFLVHVKNPPVLPNLQQIPPLRPISKEDTHLGGHNTWFFDDIDLLRQRWHSENTESVAELLIDFFRYYSRDFLYNTGVASIRAGLLKKESKGWQNDLSNKYNDSRERNRICIEDPFETDYNVARCVTKDGLYTIRGEFMRACRVLAARPERAILALAELCAERTAEDLVTAPGPSAPRLSTLPPQTPYSVGSQSMRPKGADRFSPPTKFTEPTARPVAIRPPPEHMAPKRGKWTSPPPPDAPSADQILFENQLENGLVLATAHTEAREPESQHNDSSSNSEAFSEEERSDVDDVISVRSFTEGSAHITAPTIRRASWMFPGPGKLGYGHVDLSTDAPPRLVPLPRGRFRASHSPPTSSKVTLDTLVPPSANRNDISKRPHRLSPSPDSPNLQPFSDNTTVFYETGSPSRSPRTHFLYPNIGTHSHSPLLSPHNQYPIPVPQDIFSPTGGRMLLSNAGSRSSTPQSPSHTPHPQHHHSRSSSTIMAPTPPSNVLTFRQNHDRAYPLSLAMLEGEASSPTPSSTGYAASGSRSPSPRSLSPSPPPSLLPSSVKVNDDLKSAPVER